MKTPVAILSALVVSAIIILGIMTIIKEKNKKPQKLIPPQKQQKLDENEDDYNYNKNYYNDGRYVKDPYFRPAVPKGALTYTSDKYRRIRKPLFMSSLDAELADNLGYPAVNTQWDSVGLLTSTNVNDDTILTLHKRAIDPYREFYQYRAINKDGIVIPLTETYLENGDKIAKIDGLESVGEFEVKLYDQNKYVYV